MTFHLLGNTLWAMPPDSLRGGIVYYAGMGWPPQRSKVTRAGIKRWGDTERLTAAEALRLVDWEHENEWREMVGNLEPKGDA